ncbi:MAG: hypothetical protein ABEJ42_10465 [Halobacteriaceae archaeon]
MQRRRLLASVGLLAGAAGCGGTTSGDGADPSTNAPASTGSTTQPTTSTSESATTDTPTSTVPVYEQRANEEVTSSLPLDTGFATPGGWLDGDVPVQRVSEPTRAALAEALGASGPSLVVFDTTGTIDLGGEPVSVTGGPTWVAGQTAGNPGVSLVRGSLVVSADDCVVQHLSIYAGDAESSSTGTVATTVSTSTAPAADGYAVTTAEGTETVVLDHLTAGWGRHGALRVGADARDTTVVNCLLGETLTDDPGEESQDAGILVGEDADRVALLANTVAENARGNPHLAAGSRTVVGESVFSKFEHGTHVAAGAAAALVTDAYLLTGRTDAPVVSGAGTVYVDDCRATEPALDGDQAFVGPDLTVVEEPPLWPAAYRPLARETVLGTTFYQRGAFTNVETPLREGLLASVETGEGAYVADPAEAGGYPAVEGERFTRDVPDANRRCWLDYLARGVEGHVNRPGWQTVCSSSEDP